MTELAEIEELKRHFKKKILEVAVMNDRRATLTVVPAELVEVSGFLWKDMHFRFIIATALETDTGIEILYHFSKDSTGLIMNLRVILDKGSPSVASLTGLFEGANWIEREMHEIMGIHFNNHPNLEKLISDGNWASGEFPFRKRDEPACRQAGDKGQGTCE